MLMIIHNMFIFKRKAYCGFIFHRTVNMATVYQLNRKYDQDKFGVLQYRSEISGLRTRKTHAQFLHKRVLKNACQRKKLKNRSPQTSSALPIKIHFIKKFPCFNSQGVE